MKNLTIEISSPPDREYLVAEIWLGNQMIAEVNQENHNLELEIFTNEKGKLKLNYEDFFEILKEVKKKLVGD